MQSYKNGRLEQSVSKGYFQVTPIGQIQEINIYGSLPEDVVEHEVVELKLNIFLQEVVSSASRWQLELRELMHTREAQLLSQRNPSLGSNQWLEILRRRTDKFIVTVSSGLKIIYS